MRTSGGISLNAPIVFGVAGRRPDAATAVATVTTIGYLGLLIGPPLVGIVAQLTGLRVSFVVLALIAVAVAAAATRASRLTTRLVSPFVPRLCQECANFETDTFAYRGGGYHHVITTTRRMEPPMHRTQLALILALLTVLLAVPAADAAPPPRSS
jgi:MFS family permease